MMTNERFEFGDRVRHADRPEWGIGSVVKAEDVNTNGQSSQRVSVRFPGVGVKTLHTARARLQRAGNEPAAPAGDDPAHPVAVWDKIGDADWLAPVAQRKIEETMISLPMEVRDPFNSLSHRLAFMLRLYRFDRTGHALIDWAVAQTGLKDPLSRFNRHELELFFDRWAFERDAQLGRLLEEVGTDQQLVEKLLARAPAGAQEAVRRLMTVR
jgi:hypothetical protein